MPVLSIEEAVKKHHWFQIAEDGVVEMFLDHHALSSFRNCEGYFELSIMSSIKPKYKSWNLEFGIIWHHMVEEFYIAKRDGTFEATSWLNKAINYWQEYKMHEQFSENEMFKKLGGLLGLINLCSQYAEHFAAEVDRLRVIGIEITFGKNREVPLGQFRATKAVPHTQGWYWQDVRCYLTGRIDFLMDNGHAIGPLDHKTTAFFGKQSPQSTYDPQEGMTGYVYAAQRIIKDKFPELLGQRKVDRIWMNFASVTPPPDGDPLKRFKRVPIFKTDWQLEQYRLRQLRTFHKIYDMLILGERADWNTSVCNNIFHKPCPYKNIHLQNASSSMINILNTDFTVAEPWNPEKADVQRGDLI